MIAESVEQAKSASELVEVDYDELPAVANLETASSGAEIHEGMAENRYFDWELGDEAETDKALKSAAKVVKLTVRNNRLIPNAMEPRCALAEYDDLA